MKDILKRLLDAELKAQSFVREAKQQRDIITKEAQQEVERAEERFNARIPEIYSSFENKARERAMQTINELQRRCDERCNELNNEAEIRHNLAVKSVLNKLLNIDAEN
ncbi:MAG: ATPase [Gammaproteobacteria bacterium]|nr:ATPase [Gammaproteobacteria bacterium]